jgi:urease accessory protein
VVEALLPRATSLHRAGAWQEDAARDAVVLSYADRSRLGRRRCLGEGGLAFMLDLPGAPVLHDGDGLELEDGSLVLVRAAEEPLVEVAAATPDQLARIAWHLGSRRLPCEIGGGRLRLRDEPDGLRLLERLGAAFRRLRAPFDPKGGPAGAGQERDPGRGP